MTGGSMSTIYETSHADFPGVYAVRGRLDGWPLAEALSFRSLN